MIRTLEIPKENWLGFLENVNRRALGRSIRLEAIGRDLGDQEMGNLLPLRGIAFETKGSARGALFIMAGTDEEELSHQIATPTRIYLGHNEAAEMEWLAVEEADGARTLIYFEELLALPEELHEQHPPVA
jgi:hypothetical protein